MQQTVSAGRGSAGGRRLTWEAVITGWVRVAACRLHVRLSLCGQHTLWRATPDWVPALWPHRHPSLPSSSKPPLTLLPPPLSIYIRPWTRRSCPPPGNLNSEWMRWVEIFQSDWYTLIISLYIYIFRCTYTVGFESNGDCNTSQPRRLSANRGGRKVTDLNAAVAAAGALSTDAAPTLFVTPSVCPVSVSAPTKVASSSSKVGPAVLRSARVACGVTADRSVRRGGLRSRCCRWSRCCCSFFSPPSCQRSRPVVPAPHSSGIKLPTGSACVAAFSSSFKKKKKSWKH